MALAHEKILLVEDTDTQGVVIGIMKNHIQWGKTPEDWPVHIQGRVGKEGIFNTDILEVARKASDLKKFGIIVDADSSLSSTWDKVAAFCKKHGGSPPAACPKNGLITQIGDIMFGAWVMPNNELAGMLEHLCHELVPPEAEGLWKYAEEAAKEAKAKGAKFPDLYAPKAHIHTWLAWQEIPGIRMGMAITGKMLNHTSPTADAFVKWFITLFELTPKVNP